MTCLTLTLTLSLTLTLTLTMTQAYEHAHVPCGSCLVFSCGCLVLCWYLNIAKREVAATPVDISVGGPKMKDVRVGGPVGVSSSPPRSGPHVFSIVTIPFTRIISTLLTPDSPLVRVRVTVRVRVRENSQEI